MPWPATKPRPGGVRCPACDGGQSSVLETRPTADGRHTRRRRRCADPTCAFTFTTHEIVATDHVDVGKEVDVILDAMDVARTLVTKLRPI